MSINVYWSCLEEEGLRALEPEPILKNFYNSNAYDQDSGISGCPAFSDYFKNVFLLKSIYEYSLFFDQEKNTLVSPNYDQKFFDSHVLLRSTKTRLISFYTNFIFFTDKDSLLMSLEPPSLNIDNNLSNISVIPGVFDIGKWYRPIDFAFILKDGVDAFYIKEGQPLYQLRFHTDEKINFIRFFENDQLEKNKKLVLNSKNNHLKKRNLEYYYNIFSLKKNILKNIKENLQQPTSKFYF